MRLSTLWPTCQKPFILLLALFFVFFSSLFGQAGSLDISFGDSGKTVTNFHYTDRLYAAVVQLDDKIVVAGTTFNDSDNIYSFTLVRYQRNGKIDSSFGNYGKVTTSLGEQSSARALLLQQDGKLIAVGSVPIVPSYKRGQIL